MASRFVYSGAPQAMPRGMVVDAGFQGMKPFVIGV